ncbi:cytochrome c [Aquirufa sp. HETE-83D]|uniref:Cytochrome c n=1 Tax=Aquirufa esocilacus TaxID=3096513 RepID=A0ABW6DFB8_9BACT
MKKLAPLLIAFFFFSCSSKEEITQQQYSIEGMGLYKTHCENCHQADGSGLRDLYPSIQKSNVSPEVLACLIKNGKKGNGFMPANAKLQALDIAELITFMRERWGGKKQIFPADSVKLALKNCP